MMVELSKRILIFNVNWLGDVLFSTATIRNIRRNFPYSHIACIVPSRCYPILKDNPYLNEIIIFDEEDRHRGFLSKLGFIRKLRRRKFDTVFLLHRSLTRAFICWLAGIPQRIGYYTRKRGFLLTKKVKRLKCNHPHRIDYYLDIIENAGLRVEDRYTEFFFKEQDSSFIDEFLKQKSVKKDDYLVVVNPGGNWLPKRWPKEYWAELADRLISETKVRVVISGSLQDVTLAREIKDLMKEKPIIASGRLNLKQLGVLCKRADLFITADTGPLHIANAVGAKKIIAIFGPTAPEITGPYPLKNVTILRKDIGCRIPCYEVKCKNNRCMKAVIVDDLIKEIKSKLNR
ncbi:MAG: lipopolysaccharide heptosyltransferase II [Candidatus Omnitrophota bacterium]